VATAVLGSSSPAANLARLRRLQLGPLDDVPGPVVGSCVALAYLALAQYVIWLNDPVRVGAGYWPAAGITLAALLLLPTRRWGWVLGGVVVAEIGGDAIHEYPLAASAWWAAGNALEPLVAALLLRRLGTGARLVPVRDLVRFLVAGVVVGPLVGAAIGSIGTASEYGTSQVEVLLKWWAGDGLGVLVVAPLLLSYWHPSSTRRSRAELGVLALVAAVVCAVAFRDWNEEWNPVTPYAVFPFVMWASVRFGIRGAAIMGFAVAEVANLATGLGYGPFNLAETGSGHDVVVLQVFLASAITAGLVIATLVTDAVTQTAQYERQRSVASALQETVLPHHLPSVEGLALAARYLPASPDATIHVGGDWYDAFPLGDGATGLVVGDVAGHDLGAAVVMGQLRNGLRSLLMELGDPVEVMSALDRQLAASDDDFLASAIIGVLRDGELRWVNAGHPPLLLVPADGRARYLEAEPSPMLGIGGADYVLQRTPLAVGDVVVGFTDGLVEHPSWSLLDGFAHVARLADATSSRDPDALCERLLADGLGGRSRRDDTCILVMLRES
jgi:integral membrane sensor domain MASE1